MGMEVFIRGVAGFLGSHLAEAFLADGVLGLLALSQEQVNPLVEGARKLLNTGSPLIQLPETRKKHMRVWSAGCPAAPRQSSPSMAPTIRWLSEL